MKYQIVIQKPAKKFLDKLPYEERARIVAAIELLPNGTDIKPMKGHPGIYRLRVGTYRVIYTVDNGRFIVYVINAGNRGDVYK